MKLFTFLKLEIISIRVMLLCIATLSLFISSCAHRSPAFDKDKVIETSGKEPDWVRDAKDMKEKGDFLYFRGKAIKVADASLGNSQSEADAKKRVIRAISDYMIAEFSGSAIGDNKSEGSVGFFAEETIASATEKVRLSGLLPVESYYERKVDNVTEERYYNCYALVKISKQDYNSARKMAIESLIEKARAENNQKAEESAKKVKEKLEKE